MSESVPTPRFMTGAEWNREAIYTLEKRVDGLADSLSKLWVQFDSLKARCASAADSPDDTVTVASYEGGWAHIGEGVFVKDTDGKPVPAGD